MRDINSLFWIYRPYRMGRRASGPHRFHFRTDTDGAKHGAFILVVWVRHGFHLPSIIQPVCIPARSAHRFGRRPGFPAVVSAFFTGHTSGSRAPRLPNIRYNKRRSNRSYVSADGLLFSARGIVVHCIAFIIAFPAMANKYGFRACLSHNIDQLCSSYGISFRLASALRHRYYSARSVDFPGIYGPRRRASGIFRTAGEVAWQTK